MAKAARHPAKMTPPKGRTALARFSVFLRFGPPLRAAAGRSEGLEVRTAAQRVEAAIVFQAAQKVVHIGVVGLRLGAVNRSNSPAV